MTLLPSDAILAWRRRGLRAGLFLSLVLPGLGVVPASAQTLEEALVQAYNNNPVLQARRASLRSLDEGVPQALSNWRPTVTFSGNIGQRKLETNTNNKKTADEGRTPSTADLLVTQPLYRGGRTVAQIRVAEASVQAERARLFATEQSVFLDTVTAFATVVRDQATVELNTANEQRLRRQLEATQDRFRVGEVTRTDVAQAEAALAGATAARISSEGTLETSRAQFQRVVGIPASKLTETTLPEKLPTKDDALNQAANDNPNVVAAQFEEQAQSFRVRLAQGSLLPQLSLQGETRRDSNTGSSNHSATNSANATALVTVPLYEAGNITSQVRQARETQTQRRSDIEDQRRQSINTATAAFETVLSNKAQLVSLHSQIHAAEIALEGVQQEALVGSRTVLDVLDAEQALLTAQVNLVNTQRDLTVNTYTLISATGRLTARDLNLPVEFYDFDAHYRVVRNIWWGILDALP
ncbi:MAG: TolC family outer membrane protein [Proteobacteria bacterium]|nr:TolC family outer membrane protein [Pseudomonadota bacterium]MBI3495982.1 TolC family outer membrane protein [Pseudomonadota bacterium]